MRSERSHRVTSGEHAALGRLAEAVDCSRVRVHRGDSGWLGNLARGAVLRLSLGRAVTLGNHVFLPDPCCGDLPVLAHELTHCGQYQAWGPLRYFTRGAVAQARELLHRTLGVGGSPYHYSPAPGRPFAAYGMEQQAQIVEDAFRGDPVARALFPYRHLEPEPDQAGGTASGQAHSPPAVPPA